MRAMVLAAGLGTRLRHLTKDRPKALIEVAGQTALEIVLLRLREFGIREVIVNVHHFPEMIAEYLRQNANFGMQIELSREDILLDTGGGLKQAAWFFLQDTSPEPFLLHNVDVLSTIDFARMLRFHKKHEALATLAVQKRETSRYLLFDNENQLCGRQSGPDDTAEIVRSAPEMKPLAFSGVHMISSRLLSMLSEQRAFSIITSYLRLAGKGEKILGFRADDYYWRDLGKPENIAQAEQDVKRGLLRL